MEIVDPARPGFAEEAARLFHRDGFVCIRNCLRGPELEKLRAGCDTVIRRMLEHDPARQGNRDSHRYSFAGAAVEFGCVEAWACTVDCPPVLAALRAIWGGDASFTCSGVGGDFVLPGCVEYQALHADGGLEWAMEGGATPLGILDALREGDVGVPLAVMTYYNIAYRMGLERFAESLMAAGVSGCILPDLPLEEAGPWLDVAAVAGVEPILLAAPTAPDERLPRICERSRGFVYGVGLLGVTGVRSALAASAVEIATRLKQVTDLPVLVGVGVGTPEQAVEASQHGDGVVVGSAIVQRMLDRAGPEGVAELVAEFRVALDA